MANNMTVCACLTRLDRVEMPDEERDLLKSLVRDYGYLGAIEYLKPKLWHRDTERRANHLRILESIAVSLRDALVWKRFSLNDKATWPTEDQKVLVKTISGDIQAARFTAVSYTCFDVKVAKMDSYPYGYDPQGWAIDGKAVTHWAALPL